MRPHLIDSACYGDFYDGNGTLIGHESRDVLWFLQDHPEFAGRIYFADPDKHGEIDVTEQFLGEEAAVEPHTVGRAA